MILAHLPRRDLDGILNDLLSGDITIANNNAGALFLLGTVKSKILRLYFNSFLASIGGIVEARSEIRPTAHTSHVTLLQVTFSCCN